MKYAKVENIKDYNKIPFSVEEANKEGNIVIVRGIETAPESWSVNENNQIKVVISYTDTKGVKWYYRNTVDMNGIELSDAPRKSKELIILTPKN